MKLNCNRQPSFELPLPALVGVMLLSFLTAAAPARAEETKPWFDGKSLFLFPLNSPDLPASVPHLIVAMRDGLKRTLALPDNAEVIHVDGAEFAKLDGLVVDLSNAKGKSGTKGSKLKKKSARLPL